MRIQTGLIVILFLILYPHLSFADTKLSDILYPSDSKITVSQFHKVTEAELNEISKSIEFPREYCLDHIKMRIEENILADWLFSFKKYDFTGDGNDDLIFISYCGGEEYRNYFWVKKDNKYYYSGVTKGTLIKLYHTNDSKVLSVVTRGGWCCLGYVGFINLYMPTMQDGILKYKLMKSVREFSKLTIPDKRMQSKRFAVKNEKYKLRGQPFINDAYDKLRSDIEEMPVYGNTIAIFSKGSKGMAIAQKPDDTGRIWWFVVMDADAKTEYSRFYGDQKASKAGWMSSRYLQLLSDK